MSKLFIVVPAIVTLLALPVAGVFAAEPTQAELEARRRAQIEYKIEHMTAVHSAIRERFAHKQAWLAQKKEDLRARHLRMMEWRKWKSENK
ncbi:hypothetical protein HY771_04080 [Candidatus Uhrbacteria bacterium]|nr:hypothetical protein [Candidatus Uhrbacteria bacterium]